MNNEKEPKPDANTAPESAETNDRREALKRLGKYSAYVAPFTVMALAQKAAAATGHGPGKHP